VKLANILGQERAIKRLKPMLTTRQAPTSLLFKGPRGVGKGTAALLFAKALNCTQAKLDPCNRCESCLSTDKGVDADIHFVDAAYQAALRGEEEGKQRVLRVDTVRHVARSLEMRSLLGRWKVAILDNAHTLVPEAANAILKALEEPPPKTLWILTTHRPFDLLATVRSRCQAVTFSPLSEDKIIDVLEQLAINKNDAKAAAPLAEGSVRRALELIEDPQSDPDEWIHDPLGPMRLAEALPRELHKSRPAALEQLHRMGWYIRRERGTNGYALAPVRTVMRELSDLRRALRSNADPRLVLTVAGLRLQQLKSAITPTGTTP
jgi:DNA polymerase III delta' subunit